MRRLTAAVLLFTLIAQLSGANAFAQSTHMNAGLPPWQSMTSLLGPMIAAITGPYDRTRRNPPPGRIIVTPAPAPTPQAISVQRPVPRVGTVLPGPNMLKAPLPLKDERQDPRAMRAPSAHTPQRCRSYAQQQCLQSTPSPQRPLSLFQPLIVSPVQRRSSATAVHTMTVPTVQQFQYEADTTAGPTVLFVTAGVESGDISRLAPPAPAHTPHPKP